MFGDTPSGILLLDFILVGMGLFLSPILWGIFKRLGKLSNGIVACVESITAGNTSLAKVLEQLAEAHIRDTKIEGRIKGIEKQIGAD